jgi:hypothetical protein
MDKRLRFYVELCEQIWISNGLKCSFYGDPCGTSYPKMDQTLYPVNGSRPIEHGNARRKGSAPDKNVFVPASNWSGQAGKPQAWRGVCAHRQSVHARYNWFAPMDTRPRPWKPDHAYIESI